MGNTSVTAIIVAYNSVEVIESCIASLIKQPAIDSIVVVDNCSTDDTCELIADNFPDVTLIENPTNEGFGRGNNHGLTKVTTPYALLINPDATLEAGALEKLLEAAEQYNDAAILAPILLDKNGNTHKSYKQDVFTREKKQGKYYEPEGDLCADFLSGAVWLVNMSHLAKVGFFDDQLFLYYEDDDLCMRVRHAGLGLVVVSGAKAIHSMGGSSGELNLEKIAFRQEQMAWSRLYIEQKYRGTKAAKRLAAKQRLEYAFKATWYTFQFNKAKISRYRARIKGVFEFTEGLK